MAQLHHAHMAVGRLGMWLSCSMHPWQWDGWACGLAAACTHGNGRVGHAAQNAGSHGNGMDVQQAELQHDHMTMGGYASD